MDDNRGAFQVSCLPKEKLHSSKRFSGRGLRPLNSVLSMKAMIQPSRIARDFDAHEEAFLARYARLRSWALHLTENDQERAEDLVHDAYIQFTFARPDLNSIGNLNGYLYTMLRNLHLSQVR